MKKRSGTLNVVELFAGVGGFRLALESVPGQPFNVTLSNQFEPSKKIQHASLIYRAHWPHGQHLNQDINEVLSSGTGQRAIRDAAPDMLVAGFPCQDYSVARPRSQSKGIEGTKGVLWWSIADLLGQRLADGAPIRYVLLENVDRLLSSPAPAKGRDFAIVVATLQQLGYAVEWRVVNAADYGFPQKRRRVFIVAYHETTALHARQCLEMSQDADSWLSLGVLARAFPAVARKPAQAGRTSFALPVEPFEAQRAYRPLDNGKSPFGNTGLAIAGRIHTTDVVVPAMDSYQLFTGYHDGLTLGDVVARTADVSTCFHIDAGSESRWRMAKGSKNVDRVRDGFAYRYTEGRMAFPDALDKPARTIITSEGGSTPSRTKHAVRTPEGVLRRLVPEELEELNGFPRGHTRHPQVTDAMRAFLMGNALVVGIVKRIATVLHAEHLAAAEIRDDLLLPAE